VKNYPRLGRLRGGQIQKGEGKGPVSVSYGCPHNLVQIGNSNFPYFRQEGNMTAIQTGPET